ncbi:hypothetical protein HanXRQr2_Chr01g0003831 [Helianthus annuus]|uniref:Glycine-rich protein n=1 Tax=Helianthus annuus TaxID=4232 RepID=A0A251VLA6_HELAN|nr:hypothetical protein HanXRQr2_Chr01g0003831 [Helianthus annuus]
MFLKRFLLVFVVVLIITSEITAKELASNHESEVEDAKYVHDVNEYYKGGLGVGGFINRKLKQAGYPSIPLPPNGGYGPPGK